MNNYRTLETASCIFRLDGVLVDTLDLHEKVWKKIAEIQSLPVPTTKQVMQSLHMAPIVALNKVFEWDVEGQQALEISLKHSLLVADTFREAELEALPGAKNLLLELTGNEIPAAVISNIPPEVVEDVLEKADLLVGLFPLPHMLIVFLGLHICLPSYVCFCLWLEPC